MDANLLSLTSQDGTVKLWDLRAANGAKDTTTAGGCNMGMPICMHTLKADKGLPVGGVAMCGSDAVAFLGSGICAFSVRQVCSIPLEPARWDTLCAASGLNPDSCILGPTPCVTFIQI